MRWDERKCYRGLLSASHGLATTNTTFEHRMVHKCTWYWTTIGQSWLLIDFVIASADLRPHVLNTQVKRGAELSTAQHLVVSWIRWRVRVPDRPGKPKRVVRVNWECLVEAPDHEVFNSHLRNNFSCIPGEVGNMEPKWAMFRASIVEAAARSCGHKAVSACRGGNQRTCWWTSVVNRVGYRLDLYDSGAKLILLKRFRFLNGARTDTFFKIKSKKYIYKKKH